ICNQPILGRLLDMIAKAGFTSATLSLPFLWGALQEEVESLSPPTLSLRIATPEGSFKGTVQDVLRMLSPESKAVLVIYGDSLLSADLASLCEAHARFVSCGGAATILFHRPNDIK